MTALISIVILYAIGYGIGVLIRNIRKNRELNNKLENLTNEGMLDLAHHQWNRFKSVNIHINEHALWQKWIRR